MGILGNFRTATFENGFDGRFLNENRGGERHTVTHPIFYQKERRYEYLYPATKPKIYHAWEFWEILEQLLLRMVLMGTF